MRLLTPINTIVSKGDGKNYYLYAENGKVLDAQCIDGEINVVKPSGKTPVAELGIYWTHSVHFEGFQNGENEEFVNKARM